MVSPSDQPIISFLILAYNALQIRLMNKVLNTEISKIFISFLNFFAMQIKKPKLTTAKNYLV
jgi:hypothetical protein